MTALKRWGFGCALLLLLAPVAPRPAGAAEPCPEEQSRAAVVRQRIEREWPLRQPDAVVGYVQQFGLRLAERAGIRRVSNWRISVVHDYSVNAYSIGDGLIYITEGAILAVENEAQLAAILAHEMGHDIAGHFCPRRYRDEASGSWWDFLFSSNESSTGHGSAYVGSLRQELDPEKEHEADRLAVKIMHRAGYDPRARLAVAERMAQTPDAGTRGALYEHYAALTHNRPPDTVSAHPAASGRLHHIQALLRAGQ